jgi:recombination protein RecA
MATKTSKTINTDPTAENKKKALDTALAQIEKKYGEGAIMRLGNNGLNIEAVSTGSIALDAAVGIGGLPKGRIIEIYGPESSGKTTLALHAVAEVQKAGGEAAFVDAEHALDPVYAAALGVDVDSLLVSQPDYGEQAIEIVEALARSGALDIIVVDSVAALVPKAEIDGEMGDSTMGSHARLMSKAMRKLTGVISKTNTIIIFINQLREKVGVVFGNPETTTGGRALKFYATIRMEVRRTETLKGASGEFTGAHTKVKVVKNKVAPPFKTAEFDIMFGEGISHESELIDMGVELEVLRKSGAFFYYNDDKIGQGRENAKTFLKENPEIAAEIETRIRAKIDEQKANAATEQDSLSDEVITYRPVATTKDAARAKIDVIVDDDE